MCKAQGIDQYKLNRRNGRVHGFVKKRYTGTYLYSIWDEDDVFGVHFKLFFSYIVIFLSSPSLFWCLGKTGGILYLLLLWGSVQNREEKTKGDFERLGCSKRHLVYNVYGKITKNIYSWKQKVYEVVVGGGGRGHRDGKHPVTVCVWFPTELV